MPHELQSMEELTEDIRDRTLIVFRKGIPDGVKYKFRTKKTLYTIKVDTEDTSKIEDFISSSASPIDIEDV